jgi:RNA polymerase sigma factor (sigma-70 family)
MDINYILENEELKTLLNKSIEKTFYKFRLDFIIEKDDFKQEVYIFIMKRINNFDNEKSSFRTYIPLLVMTCARNCIKKANGQSKNANKLDFKNSTYSLEYEYNNKNSSVKFDNYVSCDTDKADIKLMIEEVLNMNTLTLKQKQVISLVYKGYTSSDIAKMLNKTVSCINITLQRAREKIVQKYAL